MMHYILILFSIIFLISCFGILIKRENCLLALFSIELMYLTLIVLLISYDIISENSIGQYYALLILLLAASESAIGLGILITLYKWGNTLNFNRFSKLHG